MNPPGYLLERVRWIFLLASILMAFFQASLILTVDDAGWPIRALGIASLLWLCWWWTRGYRHAGFPAISFLFESIAIFAVALSLGSPPFSLGLIYLSLIFRSLYGSWRAFVAVLAGYLVAFYGAVTVSLTFLAGFAIPLWLVLPEGVGLVMISTVLHILAKVLGKYERSMARERTLREAGARLVSALDRESIYQATLDAALELVEGTPEVRVGVATGSDEGMEVVASAGYRAAEIRGDRFNLHTLPKPLRDRLLQKQPVEVERPESSDLRKALGLASRVRPFFVTPLLIGDELGGVIGVTSASALTEDIKEGLAALGSQVSLALESNALAEEAQKHKSEEHFRSLVQNASDVIMITGADGTLSYISPAVEQILGYKPEDIIGTDSFVPMHPDDAERVQSIFTEVASKPGVTLAFELRLQHADGSWRHLESSCTNLLHDPTVSGLVVNSRDVTERKRAEDAIQESYGILRAVTEGTTDFIYVKDLDGRYVMVNSAAADFLGKPVQEIIGKDDSELFPPETARDIIEHDRLIIATGETQIQEERDFVIDGEPRSLVAVTGVWRDTRGDAIGIFGISRDVTERKRSEKRLQESEANLAEAQRIAHLGSWEYEPKENRVRWSDETYRILGFTPRQFIPTFQDFLDSVHPEDRTLIHENMASLFRGEQPRHSVEFRIVRPDGEVRFIEGQRGAEYDETSELTKMVGTMQDVTEARLAEERLRTSEAELRALFEAMNDLIMVFDGEGRCLKIAPTSPSNLYRPPEELLDKTFHEVFPKEKADTFLDQVRRTLETRSTSTFEFDLQLDDRQGWFEFDLQLDDRQGWFEATFSPMLENTVVAVARDITERKENEEALRKSESRLAEAQRLARIGNWEWDIVTGAVFWSDEVYRILDLDPREFEVSYTAFLDRIHPDDRENVEDTLMEAYANREPFSYEARLLRPDEEIRTIHVRGEVAVDNAGTAVRMFGTTQDITETRRAEEQIRFQAHLLGQVQAAVIATDLEGTVTYWNEHAERLYGWSREEALGRNSAELPLRLTEAKRTEEIMEQLRNIEKWEGEAELRRKDGSTFFAHATISLTHDVEGRPVGMVGVSTDISERKRAEEALHRSEEKYRSVVDNVKEVIFQTDTEGLWTFLNPAWTEVTGFSVEESIGKSFLDYVHPEDRQRNLELFRPLIERKKEYCRHEIRYLTKEGGFRWIEVWERLTLDEGDAIVGTSGTLNDITERKRAEDELRRSERELTEAQRMAHVGNWSFDVTRDAGRWSDEMYRIFGFAPQEFSITYKKFLRLVHPHDKETLRRAVRAAFYEGKDRYNLDYRLVRPDGEIRFLHSQYKVVRDESGRPVSLLGTSQDVTEHQQAEDELRRSESGLAEAQRIAHLGSWDVEVSNHAASQMEHRMRWSDEMYRIFGFAPQEFVPTFKTLMKATHPQDKEYVGRAVQSAVSRGESSLTVEHRILRPDGEVRYVQAQYEMVYDESGELLKNFGTVLDITERKQAEEEIRQLNENLEERVVERTAQLEASIEELKRSEAKVQASEAELRALFAAMNDVIFVLDSHGRYLRVAPTNPSLLYKPSDELVGKTLHEVFPQEQADAFQDRIWCALQTQQPVNLEYSLRIGEREAWFAATVSPMTQEQVVFVARDITERKRAEEELREAEELFRSTFDDAAVGMSVTALDGRFTQVNRSLCEMLGYSEEELLAFTFRDITHPDDLGTSVDYLQRLLQGDLGSFQLEKRYLHASGRMVWLSLNVSAVKDSRHRPLYFVAQMQDITERKRVEEELRKAEARYRTLVENMPAVTIVQEIGSPNSPLYISPQIETLTGYSPEDCKQNPALRYEMVHPDDRAWIRAEDDKAYEPGELVVTEYRVLHRDGRTLWVRNQSFIVEDQASGSRYWQGFMVDITERKRAEEELRIYAERLAQSNRELQDFAYVASHDLQEPLRKVRAFGDRLEAKYAEALGDQGRDYLARMGGAAARMQELIDDLLTLSRVTTQAQPFAPVDLGEVAQHVISDLETRIEQAGGQVEVGELPTVEADQLQMRQLLQNLIGNALKFHKQGVPPVVKVHGKVLEERDDVSSKGSAGTKVCQILVEDNGIGFDLKYLERVFAPLQRLHGRAAYEGTGMGLAICRKVVERHGGKITAKSAPGQGAVFIVTLPVKQPGESIRGGAG